MFPELVVSASILMLSASAQHFQMAPYQVGQLSSSQSAQSSLPPNSQLFLIQRANTILSQDIGTPLQPGLLSAPILISDTAQNMLDQESKVVGYNMPFGLHQIVQQHHQAHQQSLSNLPGTQFVSVNTPNQVFIPNTPHLIPVTSADAVIRNQGAKINYGKSHGSPQSISFPVLSNNGNSRHPANVVPVRAMASIKNYFGPEKQRKDVPYFNFKNSPLLLHGNRRPHQHTKTFFNPIPKPNSIRFNPHANLYDDIPPNHPVPPRPSHSQPQQDSRREINPPSKTVYYDIPLNHPVPPPPNQSERNLYEELAQQLRQEDNGRFQPPSSLPTHDVRGEYAPARPPPEVVHHQAPSHTRPPPEVTHHQAQPSQVVREEEIINLMPPLPYRDEFRQEEQGQIEIPSPSINRPEQETIPRPDVSLSPPINDFVPPITPEESSKSIHKKPSEDSSNEQDRPTTYRPKSATEDDDVFAKPKKNSRRKSKSRSESSKEISNPDTETSHSETFYQQAPAYGNDGYSGGNTGYSYNDGGYASPQKEVIHKHIFVHAAPDSYQSHAPRVRVVRPAVAPEKHVNIIFVKSPTPPPEPQTVVELPPNHQPKTFVYILSKHPKEESGQIKLISPPKSKPHPPEIFFIRYGAKEAGNQGYPVPNLQSLYDNYGTLSNPQPQIASPPPSPGLAPGLIPPPPRGPPFRRGLMFRQKRHKDYGLDVYAPLMAYSNTGQINEITQAEADSRRTKLEDFF